MRFDYLPPFTYYRLFNIRKYFTMFWASSGLLCVLTAIFANKPALEMPTQIAAPSEVVITRPIISKNVKLQIDNASKPIKPIAKNTPKTLDLSPELKLAPKQDRWKTVKVEQGDTLSKIFTALDLPSYALHEILSANPEGEQLSSLSPGQKLKFLVSADNNDLKALKVPITNSKTLDIKLTNNGYKYTYKKEAITKKFAYFSNKIEDSLFSSGQAIGLPDKTIMQLINIFNCDIDFARQIRKDDSFKILFEEDYINGRKVETGNILMAEFTNQNKTYKAIRFTDPKGQTAYYSPEGYKMQKAFLQTPVDFTRISGRFSTHRYHPILHRIRAHKGVDYAAPHGTPVKAAGDGKIVFVGNQHGYGNTIQLQHGRKYTTLYAHLSKFSATVKRGSFVKQGQIIGFVGKTGLASGNHLHYEFRVNGQHKDPLLVTLPKALPIANQYKKAFMQHARQMVAVWAEHEVDYLATNG